MSAFAPRKPTLFFGRSWALAGLIWAQGEAEVGRLEAGRKTPEQVAAALGDLLDGWQHEGASVPKVSFHDENALEPNTQYEYCVSAGNEFGEACGPIVTVRSGKRLADPLAAYETAAKPDDVAAARAIWLRLAASKLGIPLDPAGPVPVEPGLATTRRLVAGAPFPASPAAADGEAGNGGFWRGTALVPKPGSTDTGLAG